MSLKNAPESRTHAPAGRPWSLAVRLMVWFFVASFALVLAATGYLYFVLATNLDEEDDHFLTDRVRSVAVHLRDRPADTPGLRQLIEWAGAARQDAPIYLRVLAEDQSIVAETPGMAEILAPGAFPEGVLDQGTTMCGREHRSSEGRWFRVLAVRNTSHRIQAAMDRSNEEELLEDYRRNLWIVLGLALVLCSLGSYLLVRTALRPVEAIAATAGRIRSSTLDQRIGVAGLPAELRSLAETFNDMLDRLESSFARLTQSSDDIAHELRTPLNNLRSEAEVALRRVRTPEEYREVIASSLEEYGKLSRMIDNLLFLARAENPATHIKRESIDLGAELEGLREYYETSAAEAEVGLIVSCPTKISARLDRGLLQRAVGNLVDNALAHTPGPGTVLLEAMEKDGWLTIEITDTGKGIEPTHLPHLFDRFYRVDRVRGSSKSGNTGLGLAIVKSIAALHGGSVAITSQVGTGTKVSLRLPQG